MTRRALRKYWKEQFESLPPNTPAYRAAKKLHKPYQTVRFWMKRLKVKRTDGRKIWSPERQKNGIKLKRDKIRWKDRNGKRISYAEIGRKHGVSRQRVFQIAQEGK